MSNTPETFSIPVEVVKVVLNRDQQFIMTLTSTKREIPCHERGKPA